MDEKDNISPDDDSAARLQMARAIDERCAILRDRFKAIFLKDSKDYEGYAFLNSWKKKDTGEVGPLLQPAESIRLWEEAD